MSQLCDGRLLQHSLGALISLLSFLQGICNCGMNIPLRWTWSSHPFEGLIYTDTQTCMEENVVLYVNDTTQRLFKIYNGFAQTSAPNVKAGESDRATRPKANENSVVSNKINTSQSMTGDVHTMIVPVWLQHSSNEHGKRLVYALLDCQSDACFIKESPLGRRWVSGSPVHLKLSTIMGEQIVPCTKDGLVVRGFGEHLHIDLPPTYSKENIPAKEAQIPCPETA